MSSPDTGLVSRKDIVASGLCIGCGVCLAREEAVGAHMGWDAYGQLKPKGPKEFLQRRSNEFSHTCPFSPLSANEDEIARSLFPAASQSDERIGRFEAAYVGHVAEGDFRAAGSSGGMVTWVACELLAKGLVDAVACVSPVPGGTGGGYFQYRICRSGADVRAGGKSRYHPVELSGVLDEIRSVPGRYAIVGIPCFIKACHLLRAEDRVMAERIVFTLGLFCGHMKSVRMVESFAWQMGVDEGELEAVDYRLKNPDRPANWYIAQLTSRDGSTKIQDWWHLVEGDWGSGFFQNSACNFCDDVVSETADISFGDAWVEPYSSDGKGTNVVVVRSLLIHQLVQAAIGEGRLNLDPVDAQFVAQTQAAGFRQRREGLAFRLSWPRLGVLPRKRIAPRWRGVPTRRKLIYVMRHQISAWSHRMFWLARRLDKPGLYLAWGRMALSVYHGLAYSRGPLGRFIDRLGLKGRDG